MTGTLPAGWTLFGAPFVGPSGTLQRARGPQERVGIVVQFRADMMGHPGLGERLDPFLERLKNPVAPKVLPLLYRDPSATWFLYEIRDGRLLSELAEASRARPAAPGERVAMEVVAQVADILHAACAVHPDGSTWSHHDLTPWRIVVYPSGDVALLGFGLPPVDALDWLQEDTDHPPGPGFRFTPPERIQGHEGDEDVRSDLYGLGIIAAELALGHALMTGSAREIVDLILSEYAYEKIRHLNGSARRVIWPLVRSKPEGRPSSAAEVAQRAREAAKHVTGPTLAEWANPPTELETEPGLPLPDLSDPDAATEVETAEPAPVPVQSINAARWTEASEGDVDPMDQEILDYEAAMRRLQPVPRIPEMPLLPEDRPLVVPPEPPPPAKERISPARLVWPDAPPLLMLTSVNVDLDGQTVIRQDGRREDLSDLQAQVLAYLAGQRGLEASTEKIWHSAIGGRHGSPESLKGLVIRLRAKIEEDPELPDHLVDGDKGGYRFVGGEAASDPAPLPELEGPLAGREDQERELYQSLEWDDTVLVSVVGPPGSGASQLALGAGWRLQTAGFEVHRAVVGGSERFTSTIARGLGIRSIGRPHTEVLHDIGARLHESNKLVLLLDAPRPHAALRANVAAWLALQPRGVILLAARSALGLPREKVIRLGPLELERAMELFRERVERHRPGARVTDDTARAIAEFLDRMPVAIGAAAAQTAFVTPESLLERLASGLDLDLGEGGSAGMDANLADIVQQLDIVDRKALEQLSVFDGGFDLMAAESVVRLPPGERRSMMSVLDTLEARSLLRSVDTGDGGARRWALFEIVKAYLRRTLSAEERLAMGARHARYYSGIGLRLGAGPWVEEAQRAKLIEESANLHAALARGGHEAAGAAIGLSAILGSQAAGSLAEDIERLADSLDLGSDVSTATMWAASRVASARVQLYLGQVQKARAALREAASELTTDDVRLLVDVAWMHTELGSTFGSESALHRVTTTDPWVLAVVGLLEGRAQFAKLEHKAAERSMVQALHGFAEIEAQVGEAHTQRHIAEVLVSRGKARRAVTQLHGARRTFEEVSDVASALQCRIRAAELLVGLGQQRRAREHLEAVITEAKATSAQGLLAFARGILAVVYAMGERQESAEHHFYLALANASPQHQRIQALYGLHLLLTGDRDTAVDEARSAMPDPVARAVVAVLERSLPPRDHDEAYLVYDALEAWRASAPLDRIDEDLGDRASLAVRMVLAAPPP